MTVKYERSGGCFVKISETEEDRRRLTREAEILGVAAHPGVVGTVGTAWTSGTAPPAAGLSRLVLRLVPGPTLAEVGPQPSPLVAGWGAAVATVLADLHAIGVAHGAVCPEHVIIDEHGRPVLCGLGSACRIDPGAGTAERGRDVCGLARTLLSILEPGDPGLRRLLTRWTGGRDRPHRDAGALARALVHRVPDARIGSPVPTAPPPCDDRPAGADDRNPGAPPRPVGCDPAVAAQGAPMAEGPETGSEVDGVSRRMPAGVGLGVCAGILIGLVGGFVAFRGSGVSAGSGGRHGGAGPPAVSAPRLAVPAFAVSAVAGQHPVVAVGRWGCGPARPAVLDLASGYAWIFSVVPGPGQQVTATPLGRLPGASGLQLSSDGAACDRLLLLPRAGPPATVVLGPGRPHLARPGGGPR